MNFISRLLIAYICSITVLHAANEPLQVGVERFVPPFVMQETNNQSGGFDLDMMTSLCKIMQRDCRFQMMKFNELLPAVASRKIDVAVSSITITLERAKMVRFSTPYLLSYSRFLMKHSEGEITEPFSLALLSDKKIGIVSGTIFAEQLQQMKIKNPTVKEYDTIQLLLEGLSKDEVDFILMDNPSAIYWEANSSGSLHTIGPSFLYGYGIGIAVNPQDNDLLVSINKALLQYQSSTDFKRNYDKFILQF